MLKHVTSLYSVLPPNHSFLVGNMSRLSTSVDSHMPCNPALGQLLPYSDDHNWYVLRCTFDPEIKIVIQVVRAIRITTLDHELW